MGVLAGTLFRATRKVPDRTTAEFLLGVLDRTTGLPLGVLVVSSCLVAILPAGAVAGRDPLVRALLGCLSSLKNQETEMQETSKQPIRTRYLDHVTRDWLSANQYFLIRSVPAEMCLPRPVVLHTSSH